MKKILLPIVILVFILVPLFSYGASGSGGGTETIYLLSGSAGGSWYPIGAGIADVLTKYGLDAAVEVGGGTSNVVALSQSQGDIGFTNGFVPAMAANGEAPFDKKYSNIYGLGILMDNVTQIVVTQESGVENFMDLKGKSFISLPLSASSTIAFQIVLKCFDMVEDDMKISRGNMSYGAAQIKDRNAVGFHATTGFPTAAISELAASLPIRILSIDDEVFEKLKEINDGFVRMRIPANTYRGQDKEVLTVGAPTIFICRKDLPEEVAYKIIKIMAENMADINVIHGSLMNLTAEKLATISGIEIHPGALRYYREVGLVD